MNDPSSLICVVASAMNAACPKNATPYHAHNSATDYGENGVNAFQYAYASHATFIPTNAANFAASAFNRSLDPFVANVRAHRRICSPRAVQSPAPAPWRFRPRMRVRSPCPRTSTV